MVRGACRGRLRIASQLEVSAGVHTRIDSWFGITERGSDYGRELRGGVVTFVAMAYIIVLNPLILGTVRDVNGNLIGGAADERVAIAMVTAGTALVAGLMTIAMGVFGRFPIGVAAGLGLNGYLAFTLAPQMTWAAAMGLVVLEGAVVLVLVLTGLRAAVFHSLPESLKYAIGVGIGLFITFIGLVNAGVVRPGSPVLSFGVDGQLRGWPLFTFVVGLLLTIVLMVRRVRGALLIGIVVTAVLAILIESIAHIGPAGPDHPTGWHLTVPAWPGQPVANPNFGLLGQFDLFGAFGSVGLVGASLALFSLVLSDFFDTMGTAYGLAEEADLLDAEGDIPHLESILVVDAVSAMAGGAASVSSNTAYVDSATGIGEGARTGVASVVTGGLFLLAMFCAPLVSAIPQEAATPALVIVGFLMLGQIRHIDFTDLADGIPAFLTIVLMPFTYSIVNGIGGGVITYTLIRIVTGRWREVPGLLWVISAAFVVYFAINPLSELLGVAN